MTADLETFFAQVVLRFIIFNLKVFLIKVEVNRREKASLKREDCLPIIDCL